MTDPDDGFVNPEAIEDEQTDWSLFEGDKGELPLDVRQCLASLLRRPMLTEKHQPRAWETLLAHRGIIRSRLNDLFLDLVLDVDRGVAYKVQVRSEVARRFPTLLRDTSYSREETILLVFLRQRFLSEPGDRVRVDRQECLDAIARYRPETATDVYGDETRARNAVESLRTMGLLERTAEEDRLIISPAIETLLPLSRLTELLDWLARANNTHESEEPALIDLDPEEAAALAEARAAQNPLVDERPLDEPGMDQEDDDE